MTEPLLCARHNAFYVFTVKCCFPTQRLAWLLESSPRLVPLFFLLTVSFTGLGPGQALDKYLVDFGISQMGSSVKK